MLDGHNDDSFMQYSDTIHKSFYITAEFSINQSVFKQTHKLTDRLSPVMALNEQ